MTILIANSNPLHDRWVGELAIELKADTVATKAQLQQRCAERSYDYIFFPHWSYIIPANIFENNECVVFHMTDLPYGRGGSPLQNLIVRGYHTTKLTALRVAAGLDTGPVYFKDELSLAGTAREIFLRAGKLMRSAIHRILRTRPEPIPQTGDATTFKRRKPHESNIATLGELEKVYDYIRMLDADGYPPAFIETEHLRFEFSRAARHADKIIADVRITRK